MNNEKNPEISPAKNPELKEVDITAHQAGVDSVSSLEKEKIDEYSYIIDAVASLLFAKKKLPPSIDYNDLHSVGFYGLLKAIRGFKKDMDVQFKTYANIRVRGEMLDLIEHFHQ